MTLVYLLIISSSLFAETQDQILAKKVRDQFVLQPELFDGFLEVSVEGGVVTLRGRVLSEKERDLAIETARKVTGVITVRTELEVKPLTSEDAEALKAMRGSAQAPVYTPPITAPPKKPRSLGPFPTGIDTPAERMRAQQNRVAEDYRIRRDVEFAIQMEAGMQRVQSVYVSVNEGVVSLSGVVEDRVVRFKIEQAARRVRGVKSVTNSLAVR